LTRVRNPGSPLWLAVLLAGPQADVARRDPPPLLCSGTGPAFRLTLEANRAVLSLPPVSAVLLDGRFGADDLRSYGWRGRAPGGRDLVAFVSDATCQDAAAETSPFSVRLSLPDGRFVSGCCRRADEARAEEPEAEPTPPPSTTPTPAPTLGDWISSISTFVPAIKACVQEQGRAEAVVFAAVTPDKTAHLVLRLPGGRYADCELPPGRGPARIATRRRDAPTSPEERAAVLTLLRMGPPVSEPCFRPQLVLDDEGRKLGWVSLKGC
jgi:hypothetical protein